MFDPVYGLRHYEVLVALHPRCAALDSEGVCVVTDIDPINPGFSPVRAGQAGSLHQDQGSNGDGDYRVPHHPLLVCLASQGRRNSLS